MVDQKQIEQQLDKDTFLAAVDKLPDTKLDHGKWESFRPLAQQIINGEAASLAETINVSHPEQLKTLFAPEHNGAFTKTEQDIREQLWKAMQEQFSPEEINAVMDIREKEDKKRSAERFKTGVERIKGDKAAQESLKEADPELFKSIMNLSTEGLNRLIEQIRDIPLNSPAVVEQAAPGASASTSTTASSSSQSSSTDDADDADEAKKKAADAAAADELKQQQEAKEAADEKAKAEQAAEAKKAADEQWAKEHPTLAAVDSGLKRMGINVGAIAETGGAMAGSAVAFISGLFSLGNNAPHHEAAATARTSADASGRASHASSTPPQHSTIIRRPSPQGSLSATGHPVVPPLVQGNNGLSGASAGHRNGNRFKAGFAPAGINDFTGSTSLPPGTNDQPRSTEVKEGEPLVYVEGQYHAFVKRDGVLYRAMSEGVDLLNPDVTMGLEGHRGYEIAKHGVAQVSPAALAGNIALEAQKALGAKGASPAEARSFYDTVYAKALHEIITPGFDKLNTQEQVAAIFDSSTAAGFMGSDSKGSSTISPQMFAATKAGVASVLKRDLGPEMAKALNAAREIQDTHTLDENYGKILARSGINVPEQYAGQFPKPAYFNSTADAMAAPGQTRNG